MNTPISRQGSAHSQILYIHKNSVRAKRGEHFQKAHTHTCSLARPASGQQHYVATSPHFADEWLQQCPPADGELMWISMQMLQNMIEVTHLVKKPTEMHCTQQTTAQVATERRKGAQDVGRGNGL